MGEQYEAKVFRSGNSVALRLPKALGIAEGEVARIKQHENGDLAVTLMGRAKRKFNIDKVWGSAVGSGLKFIECADRVFDPRPSSPDAEAEVPQIGA